MTSTQLAGHSALITGGGSGIGLGCARHLARDGAAVVLAGRSEERLAAGVASILTELPDAEVHTVRCDVTDEAAVAEACSVAAGVGTFTMCVANAGFGSASPFHLTTLDDWNSVLGTNLTGAFLTMKHADDTTMRNMRALVGSLSSIFIACFCASS